MLQWKVSGGCGFHGPRRTTVTLPSAAAAIGRRTSSFSALLWKSIAFLWWNVCFLVSDSTIGCLGNPQLFASLGPVTNVDPSLKFLKLAYFRRKMECGIEIWVWDKLRAHGRVIWKIRNGKRRWFEFRGVALVGLLSARFETPRYELLSLDCALNKPVLRSSRAFDVVKDCDRVNSRSANLACYSSFSAGVGCSVPN